MANEPQTLPIPFPQLIRDTLTLLPAAVGEHGRGRFFQYSLSAEQADRLRELADTLDELRAEDVQLIDDAVVHDDSDGHVGRGETDRLHAISDILARLLPSEHVIDNTADQSE